MKKPRYAIKHKPTGKFLCGGEGVDYLVGEDEPIITYVSRESANRSFDIMFDETVYTEDGEFPKAEFEITEL